MSNQERWALVCALADELFDKDSWCGETHIQKAVYIALHWLGVSEFRDYEFTLYMYGPFSFDLKEDLGAMRIYGRIESQFPAGLSYGPTLRPVEKQAEQLPKTRDAEFAFIAEQFGSKGVAELERLTTALLATEKLGRNATVEKRVAQLRKWKLHFTPSEAQKAIRDADQLLADAEKQFGELGKAA